MRLLAMLPMSAAGIAISLCFPTFTAAAEAQPRARIAIEKPVPRAIDKRSASRVTVRKRSFLDAGTEVLPGDRKYTDYVFPLGYSPIDNVLGPGRDFRRQPLADPFDLKF